MYEAHFRCPVKFKSNQNALIFSKADMELPFITHNPELLATVAPQLEAELTEQLAQRNFSEQAKRFAVFPNCNSLTRFRSH